MLDKMELVHVGQAFLVGIAAGLLIVLLDTYVVQKAEAAIGLQATA